MAVYSNVTLSHGIRPAPGYPVDTGFFVTEGMLLMDFVDQIQEHMAVIGSDSAEIGTVDHLDEGQTIKLTRDENGNHHWIPIAWVTRVDDHVHLDRPGTHATQEWADSSPADLH